MKRFVCDSIIPGCDRVFTGPGDQNVLDQALAHAALNHGLATAPMPFIELVLTYTRPVLPTDNRRHLRVVGRDEDASIVGGGLFTSGAGALARSSKAHNTYRHECLLYGGTRGFLDAVVPFVRGGLALQQPVLVAVTEPRLAALRSALADDAERVMFADMADLGHNPARIIPAWRAFVDQHGGAGRPVRGVGEPIWATRHREEIVEAQFHEALLNVALSPDIPLWLLCPYDTTALDHRVIVEATKSHPVVLESHTHRCSPGYGGPAHGEHIFGTPFRRPSVAVTPVRFDTRDHGHVDDILAFAAIAGLRIDRAVKLAAAVDEVAGAVEVARAVDAVGAVDHGNLDVHIEIWSEPASLVCEITDPGTVHDPLVGRRGGTLSARDRSVRLANELCDLVQIRSGRAGTATRIRCWR